MGAYDNDKKIMRCAICEKELGFSKFEIMDGYICRNCFKKCGYTAIGFTLTPLEELTIDRVMSDYNGVATAIDQNLASINRVGGYVDFDNDNKIMTIHRTGLFGSDIPIPYNNILDFDILEDNNSIVKGKSRTKGGLGRAIAGGLLFGGVGAIVGGTTGKRKTKSKEKTIEYVTSLRIKITVKDFVIPSVYIDLINSKTKADSSTARIASNAAQEIMSFLTIIDNENNNLTDGADIETQKPIDVTSEIRKYKELLDDGIITQDEFDAKKKQMLGL